ncbi:DUF6474 family protein [Halopolyspora algeriensis]|uniref:DUF6474 family protein n=1 Tax=Halopolyspora algeriensis TaxID=1500506 RepID=UPI001FE81BAB
MAQRAKLDRKTAKTTAKSEKQKAKATAKAEKAAAKAQKKGEHGRITPGNTKKAVGVFKIVAPVLAPYIAKAAFTARDGYDRMRARRLGVPVGDLARFSGRGAALHARIAGDADALQDLRTRTDGHGDGDSTTSQVNVERFTDNAEKRLGQLTSAVRAAERMPSSRRRAAHRSVAGELSRIEDDIMRRLEL